MRALAFYVFSADGSFLEKQPSVLIKVGISKAPISRKGSLERQAPYVLTRKFVVRHLSSNDIERFWKSALLPWLVRGEWYWVPPGVLALLKEYTPRLISRSFDWGLLPKMWVNEQTLDFKLQSLIDGFDDSTSRQPDWVQISKDGRWEYFETPNLLRYKRTHTYFARIKVRGKNIRLSLGTDVFETALQLLPAKLEEIRSKYGPSG